MHIAARDGLDGDERQQLQKCWVRMNEESSASTSKEVIRESPRKVERIHASGAVSKKMDIPPIPLSDDEVPMACKSKFYFAQDSIRSTKQRGSRRGHQVYLNVYDLDQLSARLNNHVLLANNLGVFHCGVEVLGEEWFFSWGESDFTGLVCARPRCHQVHVFRESITMGASTLSEKEIRTLTQDLMSAWPANSYHPISRSCVTFAEQFIEALQTPEPFPLWVRGAVDASTNSGLYPLADWGWQWVKWWNKRQDGNGENNTNSTLALAPGSGEPGWGCGWNWLSRCNTCQHQQPVTINYML